MKKDASGQYDGVQGDQYNCPISSALSLDTLGTYYRLTHDPQILEMGQRLTDAILKQAVHREDYAFIPKGNYGLGEVADPNSAIPENWMKNGAMGWVAHGLAQFYRATGYRPALDGAGKFRPLRLEAWRDVQLGCFLASGPRFAVERLHLKTHGLAFRPAAGHVGVRTAGRRS